MNVVASNYISGDHRLVEKIVYELKSQGVFDQFRKECFSDVDTKPAYQNLRQRVEGSVAGFLKDQSWRPDMNKNQVREMLRKTITESGYLETGVERIVDQVVNPKINSVFLPKVEEIVYKFLGIEKPNRDEKDNSMQEQIDLLPNDLEAVSPESEPVEKKEDKSNDTIQELDDSKVEEDESPPFEPLEEQSLYIPPEENSIDSHLSGFSGLISHESNLSNDQKQPPIDLIQQDSQMSRNSSESRLSIVTSDENSKMDICEDSQSKSITKLNELPSKNEDKNKEKDRQKSDKHNSRSEHKSDKKDDKDRERKRSKDSKSRHSSSHRDKDRSSDRKDSRSSTSKVETNKDRSKVKDKDRTKSSSSSNSKHSTSSSREKKKESSSTSRDKEKYKSSSSNSSKDSKRSSVSKKSSSSDKKEYKKDDKSSHSSNSDKYKKDKDRKKESRLKDDHYSNRDKKNDRRSTDRDSNDGQSNRSQFLGGFANGNNPSTETQRNEQESNKIKGGDSSGSESTTKAPIIISETVEESEVLIAQKDQKVKVFKPKCASNIQEAFRLMKIRKQLAKLEKQNQLSLASVDVNDSTLISSSISLDDLKKNGFGKQLENELVQSTEFEASSLQNKTISQDNWDAMEEKLRSGILEEIDDDDIEDCKYLEPVDENHMEFLQFANKYIEEFEKLQSYIPQQVKRKRNTNSDIKNNNTKRRKSGKKTFNNYLDGPPFNTENLPLTRTEKDTSHEKKDEVKPKRNNVNKMNNQRYSSDDLYKPRPTFMSSRRRGAKQTEN